MLDFVIYVHDSKEIHLLHAIYQELVAIRRRIFNPTRITSSFGGTMPVTLTVGQTAVQTISESNAEGNVPVVGADITVVSSDPTIATVVDNGDGTATWTAVAPGTVTTEFADTVYNLSGTDTLTVVAAVPVPTAIADSFGTPV